MIGPTLSLLQLVTALDGCIRPWLLGNAFAQRIKRGHCLDDICYATLFRYPELGSCRNYIAKEHERPSNQQGSHRACNTNARLKTRATREIKYKICDMLLLSVNNGHQPINAARAAGDRAEGALF